MMKRKFSFSKNISFTNESWNLESLSNFYFNHSFVFDYSSSKSFQAHDELFAKALKSEKYFLSTFESN